MLDQLGSPLSVPFAPALGAVGDVLVVPFSLAEEDNLPSKFEERYGDKVDDFFVTTSELKEKYGKDYEKIPAGGIGLYTYLKDRIGTGLQQLLAGTRKWNLDLADRSDLAALTERASRVTDIPLMDEVESDVYERILAD